MKQVKAEPSYAQPVARQSGIEHGVWKCSSAVSKRRRDQYHNLLAPKNAAAPSRLSEHAPTTPDYANMADETPCAADEKVPDVVTTTITAGKLSRIPACSLCQQRKVRCDRKYPCMHAWCNLAHKRSLRVLRF